MREMKVTSTSATEFSATVRKRRLIEVRLRVRLRVQLRVREKE